jgi:hypothetical protein
VKRIAIVAIAATNQAVYRHYITTYWTDLIRHTAANVPHIDVYLLTEHGSTTAIYTDIDDHVLEDPDPHVRRLVPPAFRTSNVPGILSKTIHAFDVLGEHYDVFFRTNLSSMVQLSALDHLVQSSADVCYSGGLVWDDALRANLVRYGFVGHGRSVSELAELDGYPGNSFVSGSGFLLSAAEARHLVEQRDWLRFDLPDDVAIGLLLDQPRLLHGFTEIITPELPIAEMLTRLDTTAAAHVRLEHFPVVRAAALWRYVHRQPRWL